MIAPVRIWTRLIHAKPVKSVKHREVPQCEAVKRERSNWFESWERLWTHHVSITLPRYED